MEIKLNTKTLLWTVLVIVILIVLWQTLQISAIGNTVASSAPSTGGGMVGGC